MTVRFYRSADISAVGSWIIYLRFVACPRVFLLLHNNVHGFIHNIISPYVFARQHDVSGVLSVEIALTSSDFGILGERPTMIQDCVPTTVSTEWQ